MEFPLGRSLANNITNPQIDPACHELRKDLQLDPLQIIEQEPDAGLGNGSLGRLAACFLDLMATLGIPGIGYGLRFLQEYFLVACSLADLVVSTNSNEANFMRLSGSSSSEAHRAFYDVALNLQPGTPRTQAG